MVLFESDILQVAYTTEGNFLTTTWFGDTPVNEFKQGIDYIMSCFYAKKVTGLLIDTTKHHGVEPEGQQYAADLVKKYISDEQLGVNQAVVVAENVFSNISVQNFSDNLRKENHEFVLRYFTSLEDASAWLIERHKAASINKVSE